jgi:dipeptidyl aminopeptidase/acylaminoacyl peptidase
MTPYLRITLLAAATLSVMSLRPVTAQEADVPTKPRQVVQLSTAGGTRFAMRPDGEELAIIRNRKIDPKTRLPLHFVEFVSLKTGKTTGKLTKQGPLGEKITGVFNDLTYSPDGKRLAWYNTDAGNQERFIVVRDIGGDKEWTYKDKDNSPIGGPFRFSPDGKTLLFHEGARGADHNTVALLDVENAKVLGPPKEQFFRFQTRHRPIWYSPDGRTLYVRDGDDIVIRDGRTGEKKSVLANVRSGYVGLILSPDGKYFALAQPTIKSPKQEQVKGVVLWDIAADKEVRRFEEHEVVHGFSRDGKLLLMNQPYKTIRGQKVITKTFGLDFVETETGKVRGTIRYEIGPSFSKTFLFSTDGKTLLVFLDDPLKAIAQVYDVPAVK